MQTKINAIVKWLNRKTADAALPGSNTGQPYESLRSTVHIYQDLKVYRQREK